MRQKTLTVLVTIIFLGAMFGGLFHMTMGMEMTGKMTGCPFTSSGTELCNMSPDEHLSVWQSTFMTTIPGFALLMLAMLGVAVLVTVAPNLIRPRQIPRLIIAREFSERIYSYSYRPLQDLFSSGILHPKLF